MPIYEYRCSACSFQKEYLQKVSDPLHKVCPECGKESFQKMLTAAGFQLKGSGWYATDFKNGSTSKPAVKTGDTKNSESTEKSGSEKSGSETSGSEKSGSEKSGTDSAAKSESAPAAA